jgi:hypothetical protein
MGEIVAQLVLVAVGCGTRSVAGHKTVEQRGQIAVDFQPCEPHQTFIVCSGFMDKLGQNVKSWRRRFFVLTSRQKLHYFDIRPGQEHLILAEQSEGNTKCFTPTAKSRKKGTVDLKTVKELTRVSDCVTQLGVSKNYQELCMHTKNGKKERRWRFRTEDADNWMSHINMVVHSQHLEGPQREFMAPPAYSEVCSC